MMQMIRHLDRAVRNLRTELGARNSNLRSTASSMRGSEAMSMGSTASDAPMKYDSSVRFASEPNIVEVGAV